MHNAEIAQLVEHNLAKVGVASSSLVFRSKYNKHHFSVGDINAEIAQLVEHNLAKVGVASSSLVFRSQEGLKQSLESFTFSVRPARTYSNGSVEI